MSRGRANERFTIAKGSHRIRIEGQVFDARSTAERKQRSHFYSQPLEIEISESDIEALKRSAVRDDTGKFLKSAHVHFFLEGQFYRSFEGARSFHERTDKPAPVATGTSSRPPHSAQEPS